MFIELKIIIDVTYDLIGDKHIDLASLEILLQLRADRSIHKGIFLRDPDVGVQIAVIDTFDLNDKLQSLTCIFTPAKAGHTFDHIEVVLLCLNIMIQKTLYVNKECKVKCIQAALVPCSRPCALRRTCRCVRFLHMFRKGIHRLWL